MRLGVVLDVVWVWIWRGFGWLVVLKLYNVLVTFWGFWLFGVVFGLWL